MKSYKFIISGKVQGVYYRKSVHQSAVQLNFSGYVKNLLDGTVEAAVSCDELHAKVPLEGINDFIAILQQGSKSSSVSDIKQLDISEVFTGKFEIR